jgi:hypothetical protein
MKHIPCPRCGIWAPFHHPTCSARGVAPTKTLGESLAAVGLELLDRDALPGRDAREAIELTERSRFDRREDLE